MCYLLPWGEGRGAAKHPATYKTAPQQRMIWPQMSVVLRLSVAHTMPGIGKAVG